MPPRTVAASHADPSGRYQLPRAKWIPLSRSLELIFTKRQLLGWSVVLFVITICLTWSAYAIITGYADTLTASYFSSAPATDSLWGWIKYSGWTAGKWLMLLITRIISFYISFLLAYSLTTPGYVLLSTAAEKLHMGDRFNPEDSLTLRGMLTDLAEGLKIGMYGVLVTFVALLVSFIPILGQLVVFLLYTFYSALMFIDYPASRRRWTLHRKISWVSSNRSTAFRLGFVPALLSMIPLLNVFLLALLFPLLTVHATLNFTSIQEELGE